MSKAKNDSHLSSWQLQPQLQAQLPAPPYPITNWILNLRIWIWMEQLNCLSINDSFNECIWRQQTGFSHLKVCDVMLRERSVNSFNEHLKTIASKEILAKVVTWINPPPSSHGTCPDTWIMSPTIKAGAYTCKKTGKTQKWKSRSLRRAGQPNI